MTDQRQLTATYPFEAPNSEALFSRTRRVIPGGVNSPVRAFGAVGGTPRFMTGGRGAYLTDADGRHYLDLVCSFGPLILGHAHPDVLAAVHEAVDHGTSYGAPNETETLLAEEIVARVEPVEQVRLVCSGTEATMSAIRLARGFTGRSIVVKFAGCYHGHVDPLLAQTASGTTTLGPTTTTLGLPATTGGSGVQAAETLVLPYNDKPALAAAFARYGPRIACVITEAAAGNMGVVPPHPGFTAAIARHCRDHGALFISDEVMTGFRASYSGWYGIEGVRPDLMTFGKVMGGGFPAAAYGGRAEIMARLAPSGPVYQAGTLAGNPVACAAGLATLRACTPDVYSRLGRLADEVSGAVSAALSSAGVAHRVQKAGTLFSVFFTDGQVIDYADAQRQDLKAHRAFFHAMLARGVYLPPSAFEAWFVSAAIDDAALERLSDALPAAACAARDSAGD